CRRCANWQRLRKTDVIAKGVAQPAIDAIGSSRRLLAEFHALRAKLVVCLPAVGGREEQVTTSRAFGDQLAHLLGRLLIERRRARILEQYMTRIAEEHG